MCSLLQLSASNLEHDLPARQILDAVVYIEVSIMAVTRREHSLLSNGLPRHSSEGHSEKAAGEMACFAL